MGLAEMLLNMNEAEARPTILPEAAIARLAEHAARYAEQLEGPRFKIGDLVTPVSDCDIKGVGEPHRVIDVRPGALPEFGPRTGTNADGRRYDIRILAICGDTVCALWSESFKYERYVAPAGNAADVRAAD